MLMPMPTGLRDEVWNMQESFSAPKEDNPSLFTSTLTALLQKMGAGFPVSFNDFFGRQLAYHLVNDTRSPLDINQEGSASLWSQIRETEDFQAGVVPFAIIVALGRQQGEINLTIASPIYEFTPFEFGTNVPGLSPGAYIPVEALGTTMLNGTPDQSTCVTGFDNAALVYLSLPSFCFCFGQD
jgi:lysophospholipase